MFYSVQSVHMYSRKDNVIKKTNKQQINETHKLFSKRINSVSRFKIYKYTIRYESSRQYSKFSLNTLINCLKHSLVLYDNCVKRTAIEFRDENKSSDFER